MKVMGTVARIEDWEDGLRVTFNIEHRGERLHVGLGFPGLTRDKISVGDELEIDLPADDEVVQ
jgi:hypothetical protein